MAGPRCSRRERSPVNANNGAKRMDEEKRVECFRIVYAALSSSTAPEHVAAVASVRLLLIEAVGEDRQRALIAAWNDSTSAAAPVREDHAELHRLAADGVAFAFVEAGMPIEWARRQYAIFQHMPPGKAAPDRIADQVRDAARQAGDFSRARIVGSELIARAVLDGDANAIRESAAENLAILSEWEAARPNLREERGYEFDQHEWLVAHADDMANWGRRVSGRLRVDR